MAKCSSPFSSKKMEMDVRLGEKPTKSRCGTWKTRPEAVSIWNGLFLAIKSSSKVESTR